MQEHIASMNSEEIAGLDERPVGEDHPSHVEAMVEHEHDVLGDDASYTPVRRAAAGVDYFGFSVHEDYRGRLATAPGNHPSEVIPLAQKVGSVIHYAGGPQNRDLTPLARWQSYARNHISLGRFAAGVIANGIMYHLGVGEDGLKAGLFDPRVTRWHAGSTLHNRFWLSVNVPIGGSQVPTYAQKVALEELLHDAWRLGVGGHVQVKGHQEVGASECPGVPLMEQFVRPIRDGQRIGPQDPVLPPADHVKLQVPGLGEIWIIKNMYQRWVAVNEPLFLFGWPLSGMHGNDRDGHIQEFERARFEWRIGTWPQRFDVQLGRVGAELAQVRYGERMRDRADQFAPVDSFATTAQRRWFEETGMPLEMEFKAFWESWGGTEFFGCPISREFEENGKRVQYFERARLERHPEAAWDPIYHNVALGRVNAELIESRAEPGPPPPPSGPPLVSLTSWIPVAQPGDVSAAQIVNVCYAQNRRPVYDRAKIEVIAEATVRRSREFGFRTSIVAAQMLHETGFFRFGGQVRPEQNNYAGIGADNTGAAGASFPSEDDGVLAVACHMALYAYGDLPQWPQRLHQYGSRAIRRNAVAWAHENVRAADGTRLGFFGSVKRVQDYVNGRHALTNSVPIGSLENGYARALVRVANEIITATQ
jgi:hypothetical protein